MPLSNTTAIVPTKTKRPPGRPKIVIDVDRVGLLASHGMSGQQIAARLNISERTLWNKLSEDESVRAAFDCGVAEGIDYATSKLFSLIEQGNLGAICFYLRSRGGFRAGTTAELNVNVRHEGPVPTIDLTNIRNMQRQQSYLLDHDPDSEDFEDADFECVEGMS
jgi:transcriptional regulator with XRE-family HTH domain